MKNIFAFISVFLVVLNFCCLSKSTSPANKNDSFNGLVTWVSSARPPGGSLHIARTRSNGKTSEITYLTGSRYNDYKPVISPDNTKIAFFRAYSEGNNFFLWNSSICVMNTDGSGLRELTDHKFMNTEPYWTRDGSNRITWSRMIHSSEGKMGTYSFRTTIDANPGDEQQFKGRTCICKKKECILPDDTGS